MILRLLLTMVLFLTTNVFSQHGVNREKALTEQSKRVLQAALAGQSAFRIVGSHRSSMQVVLPEMPATRDPSPDEPIVLSTAVLWTLRHERLMRQGDDEIKKMIMELLFKNNEQAQIRHEADEDSSLPVPQESHEVDDDYLQKITLRHCLKSFLSFRWLWELLDDGDELGGVLRP